MLITKEELSRRLGSEKNLINILGEPDSAEKSFKQTEKAKESEKVVLGVLAASVKPDKIAAAFDLDKYDVEQAKKDETVKPKVEYSLKRMQDIAIEKTMAALGLISDEKLGNAELRDLVHTASQLSRIVERTIPKNNENNTQVSVNIYAPAPRSEREYQVIDLK